MNVCSPSFRMLWGSLSCIEREMSSTRAPVDSHALSATHPRLKSATRHPQVPMTLCLMPALPCVCTRCTSMPLTYPSGGIAPSGISACYPSGDNPPLQHLAPYQAEFSERPNDVNR